MAFFKPDPADIRDARRDLHREALIRGSVSIPEPAQPAAVEAMDELVDEGVVTRRGDRGVAITDDHDAYRAARAIMLALEGNGGTVPVDNLAARIAHTDATTAAAVGYLRKHKLVALRDGELNDRTGDKLRGRKTTGSVESIELAAIERTARAVRKNVEALGESTSWFAHPTDDKWTPEALREIRTATNNVYRALPPSKRWTEERFRRDAAHFTTDHVDAVMARLEAAKFIAVRDGVVTSHAALPEPKPEKPAPVTPKPEPTAVAAGGVGDLASLSEPAPKVIAPVAPAPEPKPEVVETPNTAGDTTSSPTDPKPSGTAPVAPAIGHRAEDAKTETDTEKPEDTETPPAAPTSTSTAVATREDATVAPTRTPPAADQGVNADMTTWLAAIANYTQVMAHAMVAPQASAREALNGGALLHVVLRRVMVIIQREGRPMKCGELTPMAYNKSYPAKRKMVPVALDYGVKRGVLTRTGNTYGGSYAIADPTRVDISRQEIVDAAWEPAMKIKAMKDRREAKKRALKR